MRGRGANHEPTSKNPFRHSGAHRLSSFLRAPSDGHPSILSSNRIRTSTAVGEDDRNSKRWFAQREIVESLRGFLERFFELPIRWHRFVKDGDLYRASDRVERRAVFQPRCDPGPLLSSRISHATRYREVAKRSRRPCRGDSLEHLRIFRPVLGEKISYVSGIISAGDVVSEVDPHDDGTRLQMKQLLGDDLVSIES